MVAGAEDENPEMHLARGGTHSLRSFICRARSSPDPG
jgi:hypothetical protein